MFEAETGIGTNQQFSLKVSRKQVYLLNGVQVVVRSNRTTPTNISE